MAEGTAYQASFALLLFLLVVVFVHYYYYYYYYYYYVVVVVVVVVLDNFAKYNTGIMCIIFPTKIAFTLNDMCISLSCSAIVPCTEYNAYAQYHAQVLYAYYSYSCGWFGWSTCYG